MVTDMLKWIKNVKFKITKIRTGCQYIRYFYYCENLLGRKKTSTGPHACRGLDIAVLDAVVKVE